MKSCATRLGAQFFNLMIPYDDRGMGKLTGSAFRPRPNVPTRNKELGKNARKSPLATRLFVCRSAKPVVTPLGRKSRPLAWKACAISVPVTVSSVGRSHCSPSRSANLSLRRRVQGLFEPATTTSSSWNKTSASRSLSTGGSRRPKFSSQLRSRRARYWCDTSKRASRARQYEKIGAEIH